MPNYNPLPRHHYTTCDWQCATGVAHIQVVLHDAQSTMRQESRRRDFRMVIRLVAGLAIASAGILLLVG